MPLRPSPNSFLFLLFATLLSLGALPEVQAKEVKELRVDDVAERALIVPPPPTASSSKNPLKKIWQKAKEGLPSRKKDIKETKCCEIGDVPNLLRDSAVFFGGPVLAPQTETPTNPGMGLQTGQQSLQSAQTGKEPPSPLTRPHYQSLRSASQAADDVRTREFISQALEYRDRVSNQAKKDNSLLDNAYVGLDIDKLDEHFARAKENLNRMAYFLSGTEPEKGGPREGTMDEAARAYNRNIMLNAADLAEAAKDIVARERASQQGRQTSLFGGAFDPNLSRGGGKVSLAAKDLNDVLGGNAPPTSQDALTRRTVLLNGLPEDKRQEMFRQLQLAEPQEVLNADGSIQMLQLLHNGYIFGGGKTGTDCSAFVSAALPAEVRKGRLTTLDMRGIWFYLRDGELPLPPKWKTKRATFLKKAAPAFVPFNLYEGEQPMRGDLLVFRPTNLNTGHVFLVTSYDRKRMVAGVLEASQSAGGIREREFHLSMDPLDQPVRQVRKGFMGLRLKPVDNAVCSYRNNERKTKKQ